MHPTAEQIQRMGWSVSVTYYTPEDREEAARQGATLPTVGADATRRGRRLWAPGDTEAEALADLLAQVQREAEVPA